MRSPGALVLLASLALFSPESLHAAPRDVQIRSIDFETGVVELFNFGATDEPLDGWQFCTHDESRIRVYSGFSGLNGVVIEAESSLFVYINNDAPDGPDSLNRSDIGSFAIPLDPVGAYGLGLYTAGNFDDGDTIADHLQWSEGGADDTTADERSDEAENGGVWMDQEQWIATTETTVRIELKDRSGGVLHGPDAYAIAEPPQRIQIRSIDFEESVVELFNFGSADQTLDGWQLCTHDDDEALLYGEPAGLDGVTIEAGTSFFVHFQNDAPGGPDAIDVSVVGETATPLDRGPYSMSLYFSPGRLLSPDDFDNSDLIADHLQWSVGAVDDESADERSDEAELACLWTDQSEWISTTGDTRRLILGDDRGGIVHGPSDYEAVEPRAIQFRSIDFATGVVELFNFSNADQTLDGWQLCTHDDDEFLLYGEPAGLDGVTVEAGTSFSIHFQNDAPGGSDTIDASVLGELATPLDRGPYSMSLYFSPGRLLAPDDFDNPDLIADHLQWSLAGADDDSADERSDEAENGGLWTDQSQWISTKESTRRVVLADETGGVLHGPGDYRVEPSDFNRGDVDIDGVSDLSDAVFLLFALFAGRDQPSCAEAADANSDDAVDSSDAVFLLEHLFLGGPPPADPGPPTTACGPDPDAPGSDGDLGCGSYPEESCQ